MLYPDLFVNVFDIDTVNAQYLGNENVDIPQVLTSNVGLGLRSSNGNSNDFNLFFNGNGEYSKAALIAEPVGSYLKNKLHFCQNSDDDLVPASKSDAVLTLQPNGYIGINNESPQFGLDINLNQIRLANAKTPASGTANGTPGTICWDGSYIYVCTGNNVWKRTQLSPW